MTTERRGACAPPRHAVLRVELLYLAAQCLQRSAVVDDVVGGREARLARNLRRDDASHFLLRQAAACAHARDLQLDGTVHDEHPVDARAVVLRFDQQRNDKHDIGAGRSAHARRGFAPNQRMQHRLETAPRVRVGKNACTHPRAIHCAARVDRTVAEQGAHRVDRRTAGRSQCVRDRVGVDERGAEAGELIGRGALATADAASEADHERHAPRHPAASAEQRQPAAHDFRAPEQPDHARARQVRPERDRGFARVAREQHE